MKKAALWLCAVLLAFGLFGCAEKPLSITEEEALTVLTDLVPRSYEFNVIFFGEGLPIAEPPAERPATVQYLPVREDCGYRSVAEIQAAAERIYSVRYLSGVYVSAFLGVTSEDSDGGLDTSVSPRYKEIQGVLSANAAVIPLAIRGRLEVISATVGKATPQYVTTNAVCRTESGETVEMTILLTLEDGVWLLDSPTY